MEEDILNYSQTVMFRGTSPCIQYKQDNIITDIAERVPDLYFF